MTHCAQSEKTPSTPSVDQDDECTIPVVTFSDLPGAIVRLIPTILFFYAQLHSFYHLKTLTLHKSFLQLYNV